MKRRRILNFVNKECHLSNRAFVRYNKNGGNDMKTREEIIRELKQLKKRHPFINSLKRYAVMILLYQWEEELYIVYEKRGEKISQPFEISFPGGKIEEGESPIQAALRETEEELHIEEEQIEMLGELPSLLLLDGVEIIPVIGIWKWGYSHPLSTVSNEEVSFSSSESVSKLKENIPTVGKIEYQVILTEEFPVELLPGKEEYRWHRGMREIFFYPLSNGEMLWGLTAQITKYFLEQGQMIGFW